MPSKKTRQKWCQWRILTSRQQKNQKTFELQLLLRSFHFEQFIALVLPFISAWIQLPLNSPHSEGKQQTVRLLWANYFIQSSASVPIQFPPLVKTATVILFSWFQMLSCSSDDLAKFHWYLQMNRPLRNTYTTSESVPQKHFDRATVWRPAGWNA